MSAGRARKEQTSGVYEIIADVCVDEGLSLSSKPQYKLAIGTFVQVVDIKASTEEERLRGRLESGGWISLLNTTNKKTWVRPLRPGTFVVTCNSLIVTRGISLSSEKVGVFGLDEYIEVVELRYVRKDRRVRGKIFSGGYVSLVNTKRSFSGAEPVHLGAYITVSKSDISKDFKSCPLKTLETGTYIDITETIYDPEGKCLRGKLSNGSWTTLEDKKIGRRTAIPIPLGTYQTHEHLLYIHKQASLTSKGGAMLDGESFIDVIETKFVSNNNEVRGRLASGGWIILLDTKTNYKFSRPVQSGVYFTCNETLAVSTAAILNSKPLRVMLPYTPTEVVETR